MSPLLLNPKISAARLETSIMRLCGSAKGPLSLTSNFSERPFSRFSTNTTHGSGRDL